MLLIGVSQIAAGWSGKSLAGLFLTVGLIQGVGSGLVILVSSLLPVHIPLAVFMLHLP